MKRLVIIAESEEMPLVKKLGYDRFPVLITGVGALNVIEALKDVPKDIEIINIGYAGSKDLTPGKFYGVHSVTLYHPNVQYNEPVYNLKFTSSAWFEEVDESDSDFEGVRCYTGTDFVTKSDETGCLFDMELGYIMALGFKNVTAFKYVSDNLDLQEYRNTMKEVSLNEK